MPTFHTVIKQMGNNTGIEVPEEMIEAFNASAPSKRKEFIRQVNDAKKQETRERRIAKIVSQLAT